MPTQPPDADGRVSGDVFDVDGYIRSRGPFFRQDAFYEREVARVTERFGAVAHVFSTYESRRAPEAKPFMRGVNSIQLFHDGDRWWVMSVLWDNEREGNPLPADLTGL